MTFPYKGFRSMANLWVKTDDESTADYRFKISAMILGWVKDQPSGTKFEILTDDDGSLHIYTS